MDNQYLPLVWFSWEVPIDYSEVIKMQSGLESAMENISNESKRIIDDGIDQKITLFIAPILIVGAFFFKKSWLNIWIFQKITLSLQCQIK